MKVYLEGIAWKLSQADKSIKKGKKNERKKREKRTIKNNQLRKKGIPKKYITIIEDIRKYRNRHELISKLLWQK